MRYVICLLSIGAFTACSGAGSSSPSGSTSSSGITGVVSAGPVNGATVTAYSLNANGSRGSQLATSTSDANGKFSLAMAAQTSPLIIVASGGNYTEEASGSTVTMGMAQVRTALTSVTNGQQIGVTPVTEIATQNAIALMAANSSTSALAIINSSNSTVAAAMGLSDITIPPANPTQAASAASSTQAAQYAVVLAAISQIAKNASTANSTTINSLDMMQALATTLTYNGNFNASVGSTPVPVPNASGATINLSTVLGGATDFNLAMASAMMTVVGTMPPGFNNSSIVPPPTFVTEPSTPSGAPVVTIPSPPSTLPSSQPTSSGPPLPPPAGLNYSSPSAIYTISIAITADSPSSTGGPIASFAISPTLPTGLQFNSSTGEITGTPTTLASTSSYTVSATNSGGSTTKTITITINDAPPINLIYSIGSATFNLGQTITAITPSSSGGTVVSYSVSPSLPSGLSLNTTTGSITGSPTAASSSSAYIITANNSGGSTTATVNLTIIIQPSISSVSPTSGPASTAITITGTNFVTGATVSIGGFNCSSAIVASSTNITCNVPRSNLVGAIPIVVTNPNSLTSTQNVAFTYSGFVGDEQISTSNSNTCAVMGGAAYCWGELTFGALGNGSAIGTGSSVPVAVSGLTAGVTAISVGDYNACAVANGGAWCWGNGSYGSLGNNSTGNSLVPVQVQGLSSGVQSISVGPVTSCAIVNGAVWCWGDGAYGLLGPNNSSGANAVPIQISGLTSGVQSVSVGLDSACAVMNGGAWCWGFDGYGQLGNDSNDNGPTYPPVQVQGLSSGVQAISAGWYSACAVMNGGAWCWGRNDLGQLGNNSTTESLVPIQVQGLSSGVQAIAINKQQQNPQTSSACAIIDGGAKCWGDNSHGDLGNNSTTQSLIPVQVNNLTSGSVAVTVGSSSVCAIVNSGAECWGYDEEGTLGNGAPITSSPFGSLIPIQVSGFSSGMQ